MADDGYVAWYQAKLWQLLPAVYRTMDGAVPGVPGPLQELVNRIGAQTATVRRSIDRLWENQSIETCDDWVVPYIGDLLATRLVACLDAPAQRLDVAKTIYYRRRSGTLGLLEELAYDIARRDARAVEFFRRLGRTRHQFDPPIGNVFASAAPAWAGATDYIDGQVVINAGNAYQCVTGGESNATGGPTGTGTSIPDASVTWAFVDPASSLAPAVIAGLAGADSSTPAGGFADLRNAYAAGNTGTAFDEFAYTADLRRGVQSAGWYNISHLGVFIWWLQSFPILAATPVSSGANPACWTFDPSGREIPLFAPGRTPASFGDDWVSPNEWDLTVAVRDELWKRYPDQLYGNNTSDLAFWVGLMAGGQASPLTRDNVLIQPERGLFSFVNAPPNGTVVTTYHFGFMSMIGAGGFPQDVLESINQPATTATVSGGASTGANGLDEALAGIAGAATIEIGDSLTYAGPTANLTLPAAQVVLCAQDKTRPMIRWTGGSGTTWTITGAGAGCSLVLQGVWLQGADIVLAGSFDSVSLRLVTLDPGTLAQTTGGGTPPLGTTIEGMTLAPVHLFVEAAVTALTLERCITGPIVTRNGGLIEQLTATDSIIQAIAPGDLALQTAGHDVSLARTTVLGQIAVHRLDASECILDDVATVVDTQHGCVRFSAYAKSSSLHPQISNLHAPYRSVVVPAVGPQFVTRRFGEPSYARLTRLADDAIVAPQTGDTILGGAQNGSEMGAFSGEGITLKKRGLAIKFEEYAPLGIYPVWIDAD
jgi:hypothetical protein